jgi:hypothetical protein
MFQASRHTLLTDKWQLFPGEVEVKCERNGGKISASHGGEYEDDCLLGCCDVWYKFTDVSEVITAYIIRAMRKPPGLLIALMIEAGSTSETSVNLRRLHGAIFQKTVIFEMKAHVGNTYIHACICKAHKQVHSE